MRRLLLIARLFVAPLCRDPLFIARFFIALLLIALIMAVAPGANAQRMAFHTSHFAPPFRNGASSRSSFYPLAFADPFYSDYLYSTGYPLAAQPPMMFLQAPPAPAPDREPAPVQPLLIELRGDRYVRVSGGESPGAEMVTPETIARIPDPPRGEARNEEGDSALVHAATRPEPPPAVLIFRDGHREETSDYTIANGVLYTHSDFYATGSWTRKIELSSLDLPETLKSNQSRGIRFQLPSFPNEIIVRP
jgi:hypothetical protein